MFSDVNNDVDVLRKHEQIVNVSAKMESDIKVEILRIVF